MSHQSALRWRILIVLSLVLQVILPLGAVAPSPVGAAVEAPSLAATSDRESAVIDTSVMAITPLSDETPTPFLSLEATVEPDAAEPGTPVTLR